MWGEKRPSKDFRICTSTDGQLAKAIQQPGPVPVLRGCQIPRCCLSPSWDHCILLQKPSYLSPPRPLLTLIPAAGAGLPNLSLSTHTTSPVQHEWEKRGSGREDRRARTFPWVPTDLSGIQIRLFIFCLHSLLARVGKFYINYTTTNLIMGKQVLSKNSFCMSQLLSLPMQRSLTFK